MFHGHATPQKRSRVQQRFPAPPQAWFADVAPPPLTHLQLKNTRVVPSREHILPSCPKAECASRPTPGQAVSDGKSFPCWRPAKLHLCDRDFNSFDDSPFAAAIEQGIVELHEGEAAEHLAAQPDRHFDLIHLQTGPSYMAAARALEQAGRKVKDDGCIICANYTTYSPLEGIKYGVARAVNEFCHRGGFEIICLALNSLGYQDAALRKCAGSTGAGHLGGAFLDAPDPPPSCPMCGII